MLLYKFIFVITYILILLTSHISNSLAFSADEGVDHAPISERHINANEKFKKKYFYDETGKYNLEKIANFLKRIKAEKISLGQDLYESKLLENIEHEVREDFKKKDKKAKELMDDNKSELLKGYKLYLIPKIEKMLHLMINGATSFELDGLYDDFIRFYAMYYIPNNIRGIFAQDYNFFYLAKRSMFGFVFPRKSQKYVESINLRVEDINVQEISNCLAEDISIGTYLNLEQIEKLRDECNYDISKINPGVSPLWKNRQTPEERIKIRDLKEHLFPNPEEKLYFSRVRLGGKGSAKITAKFTRNGKKNKIKIKFSPENHNKIVTSFLMAFAGMSKDINMHRDIVRVYFQGNDTYKRFVQELIYKYGEDTIMRYIHAHGISEDGEEWVEIQDVLLKMNAPNVLRLESINPRGWDFDDRREYRAQILMYGWLNILDSKPNNFRGILRQTKSGYIVEHRMHDVGVSLSRSISGHHKKTLLNEFRFYGINHFTPDFIQWHENQVHIHWSDFTFQRGHFQRTTYYDLKWMARQIAKISPEELRYGIEVSGLPEQVRGLYELKISMRRNDIVKAFHLENEYPIWDLPDLKTYSPNEAVKNGKVIVQNFEGHNELEQNRQNFLTLVSDIVNFSFPMNNVTSSFEAKLQKLTTPTVTLRPVKVSHVAAGVGLTLGREVNLNQQFFNHEGKSGGFYIKDTIGIEISASSRYFKKISDRYPANLNATFKVWRKEIQFVHFAETLKEAYLSRFNLFSILRHFQQYLAFGMKPGEVFKIMDAHGIDVEASIKGPNFDPVLVNEVSGNIEWQYSSPAYFYRDHYGQLKVYKEKSHYFGAGLGLSLLRIGLIADLPILGLDFTHEAYWNKATLYSFKLPAYSSGGDVLDLNQRLKDYKAFKRFMRFRGSEEMSSLMRREMDLKAKGHLRKRNLGFLFFFFHNWTTGYSQGKVSIFDKDEEKILKFHRYYKELDVGRGMRKPNIPYHRDLAIKNRLKSEVIVEMDAQDPDNMMVLLRSQKYYRMINLHRVLSLINRQNKKFSISKDKPFYRNYILPPKDEINRYRKVYAENYVYFNGQAIQRLLDLTVNEFHKKTYDYFYKTWLPSLRHTNRIKQTGQFLKRLATVRRVTRAFKKLKKYKNSYKTKPKAFIKRLTKFFYKYDGRKNGIKSLKEIVGEKSMFVMGQIYGINHSFSTLERKEDKKVRRFAGKHWGTFMVPPIRKYFKWNRILPISDYIQSEIQLANIFGSITNFQAPME